MWRLWARLALSVLIFFSATSSVQAWDQGIYLTQYTLENPDKLNYLIHEAKATGINIFVIHCIFVPKFEVIYARGITNNNPTGI